MTERICENCGKSEYEHYYQKINGNLLLICYSVFKEKPQTSPLCRHCGKSKRQHIEQLWRGCNHYYCSGTSIYEFEPQKTGETTDTKTNWGVEKMKPKPQDSQICGKCGKPLVKLIKEGVGVWFHKIEFGDCDITPQP